MLPYILGGAAALALLGSGVARRKKHHRSADPRTAATQRLKIVDSRHAKTLRMARVNPRVAKTHIEYVIQGNYGYGWDDENTELTWPDAKRSIREYRENGGGSYRVVKRRVKNDATNPRSAWGPGEHTMHINVPGGILAAYWFDDGRWLLRYKGTIVARGTHFRPAPSYKSNEAKSGLSLINMALAALPGSGSGIAGDEDSLKAWTKEGIRLLDRSAVHDEVSILENDNESRENPKRRRKGKKAKRSSPGAAASRLAWWRWHHNPPSIPKGYKSAAGHRLGRYLRYGEPPIRSLQSAKIVARQGGDHLAFAVIRSALLAASAKRSARQAVTVARKTARMLGYTGKWS